MPTFEERLTAIEQEQAKLKHDNTELKQKIELHTIALGGLVNKTMLERINEKNDKIFQALIAHDELTNRQLAELRDRVEIQVEGKIAGLQAEIIGLQREVTGLKAGITGVQTEVTGLKVEVTELRTEVTGVQTEVAGLRTEVTGLKTEMHQRLEQQDKKLDEHTAILTQILARLPKQEP